MFIDGWKRGQGHLDGTYDRHVVCFPNKGMFGSKEQVTAPRRLSTLWHAVFIPIIHKLQENRIGKKPRQFTGPGLCIRFAIAMSTSTWFMI